MESQHWSKNSLIFFALIETIFSEKCSLATEAIASALDSTVEILVSDYVSLYWVTKGRFRLVQKALHLQNIQNI